ncbi:MAG: helix-turn-helix transcriptional regulator, partial [Clostridia bacterium]|nr:helix-turn-helix transcriptional regulator [Clostridia bacterium]
FQGKKPPKFFPFNDFALLKFLLDLSKRTYKNDENRVTAFEGIVKILLSRIAEDVPFVGTEQNKQDFLISDILRYAEERYSEDLSLKNLALVFSYSHEHLSRLLHKYLSENWCTYVDRLRAKKVNELMKENPALPVLKTAFDCGFESANTFYRAYKREYGRSPKRG